MDGLGRAITTGVNVAAPLAGAYLAGRAIDRSYRRYGNPYGGYYYPPPPVYGPSYGYSPYASPYGYGAGGVSSFLHF